MVWSNANYWAQPVSKSGSKGSREELEQMLKTVRSKNWKNFYYFAKKHFDLDQMLKYTAIDSVLGIFHHLSYQNLKFLYDPALGKFIPLPVDYYMWMPWKGLDVSVYPILNAIRTIPQFEYRRQSLIWQFMEKELTLDKINSKLDFYRSLTWPAEKYSPNREGVDNVYQGLFQPVSTIARASSKEEWETEIAHLKTAARYRHTFLRNYLSQSRVEGNLLRNGKGTTLTLWALGNVPSVLNKLIISPTNGSYQIYRDSNLNGKLDALDLQIDYLNKENKVSELLYPGLARTEVFHPSHQFHSSFREAPQSYLYFIRGPRVEGVQIGVKNAITGKESPAKDLKFARVVPSVVSNTVHPWSIEEKSAISKTVTLGPGKVFYNSSVNFPENITVIIQPGTEIILSSNVSIIFKGKVIARGKKDHPILFRGHSGNNPFGVVALQGKGTRGSVFEYCDFFGGSRAFENLVYYDGMVSVHDTDTIQFRQCHFGKNHGTGRGIQITYSNQIEFLESKIQETTAIAMACEYSQVGLTRVTIENIGSVGLLANGAKVTVDESTILRPNTVGISLDNKSTLKLTRSILRNGVTGVLVRNGSHMQIHDVEIRNFETGIDLRGEDNDTGGFLEGQTLAILGTETRIVKDPDSNFMVSDVYYSEKQKPVPSRRLR